MEEEQLVGELYFFTFDTLKNWQIRLLTTLRKQLLRLLLDPRRALSAAFSWPSRVAGRWSESVRLLECGDEDEATYLS